MRNQIKAAEYNEQNLGGHNMAPEYKRSNVVRIAKFGMVAAMQNVDPYGPTSGVAAAATGAEAQIIQIAPPAGGEPAQPLAA
jgi:hypothetical protein